MQFARSSREESLLLTMHRPPRGGMCTASASVDLQLDEPNSRQWTRKLAAVCRPIFRSPTNNSAPI